jgi:hypothetical protein
MKKFVVRIGYVDYAVEQDDAAELLAIASRAQAVERPKYDKPYYVKKEQEQFVDNLQLSEVIEEAPPDPDVVSVAEPPPKPEFPF